MGTVALTNIKKRSRDNKTVVEATATHSGTYATGGDTIALGPTGLREVHWFETSERDLLDPTQANPAAQLTTGQTVTLGGTVTAPLLKLWETPSTEVANATNVTAIVRRIRLVGV